MGMPVPTLPDEPGAASATQLVASVPRHEVRLPPGTTTDYNTYYLFVHARPRVYPGEDARYMVAVLDDDVMTASLMPCMRGFSGVLGMSARNGLTDIAANAVALAYGSLTYQPGERETSRVRQAIERMEASRHTVVVRRQEWLCDSHDGGRNMRLLGVYYV